MKLAPILVAAGCVAALTIGAVGGVAVAGTSGAPAGTGRTEIADLATPDSLDQAAMDAVDLSGVLTAGRHRRLATRTCARIPQALTTTQKLQARLAGDASTRGSLSWLQAKIHSAQSSGQPQLAKVLSDRERMLTDLGPVLSDRLTMLRDAQQLCASAGAHSSTTGSST